MKYVNFTLLTLTPLGLMSGVVGPGGLLPVLLLLIILILEG